MVTHIVMFKLKPEFKKDVPLKAKKELEAMVGKIDGLLSMEVGVDFLENNPSADLVLTATYPSREALESYATHPIHQAFLEWFRPTIAIRSVVDYEK